MHTQHTQYEPRLRIIDGETVVEMVGPPDHVRYQYKRDGDVVLRRVLSDDGETVYVDWAALPRGELVALVLARLDNEKKLDRARRALADLISAVYSHHGTSLCDSAALYEAARHAHHELDKLRSRA